MTQTIRNSMKAGRWLSHQARCHRVGNAAGDIN